MVDTFSRFLLGCEAHGAIGTEAARQGLLRVFESYGVPERMGSDNGPPFGSIALGGLSRLAVWLLKQGIRLERIEPGCPEQNGRHERLHRTLKAEAVGTTRGRDRCRDAAAQQERFDAFRREYNEQRPHEALGGACPADCYRPSERPYRDQTAGVDYPAHFERRQIRAGGCMKWRGQLVFVSEVLEGEPVGLEPVSDNVWSLYFGPLLLGRIRDGERRISAGKPPSRPREDAVSPHPSP